VPPPGPNENPKKSVRAFAQEKLVPKIHSQIRLCPDPDPSPVPGRLALKGGLEQPVQLSPDLGLCRPVRTPLKCAFAGHPDNVQPVKPHKPLQSAGDSVPGPTGPVVCLFSIALDGGHWVGSRRRGAIGTVGSGRIASGAQAGSPIGGEAETTDHLRSLELMTIEYDSQIAKNQGLYAGQVISSSLSP